MSHLIALNSIVMMHLRKSCRDSVKDLPIYHHVGTNLWYVVGQTIGNVRILSKLLQGDRR